MLKLERLVWVYSLSQGERARPPVKGYEKSETAQFIFTRKDKNEFCITKQETGGILVESVLTAKQDNPYLTDTLMAAIQRRVNNVLADKDKNTFKALEGLMGLERVAVKNTVSSTKSLVSLLESTLRKGEVETTLFHIKDKAEFKDAAKLLKVDPLTVLEEDIVFLKEYTLFMQRVADDMSRKTVMPQEFLLEERMGSALLYYIEKNREILCELADKGLLIDIPKYVSTIGVPYRGNVIEMRHLDILSLFRFVAQCIVVRRQKEIMELPKRMSIPSEKGIHLCDPT
jgi:hypothetical protein